MQIRVFIFLFMFGLTVFYAVNASPGPSVSPSIPGPSGPSIPGPGVSPSIPGPGYTPVKIQCPIGPGGCPGCEQLHGALQSSMLLVMDTNKYNITITLYYENLSASPPRQPVSNSVIIAQVFNESFSDTYKIYTDDSGAATFDFSIYKDRAVNFKFLYCPFTCSTSDPGFSKCGFLQCLDFAGIQCTLPTCEFSDLPDAPGVTPLAETKCLKLLPTIQSATYSPPPPSPITTPVICLPLLIIFALLGGALFISGKNPFAGFDFSAPRVGRHVRYQARGRAVSVSVPQPLTQWMMGKVQGAVGAGLGKALGGLAKGTQKKAGADKVAAVIGTGAAKAGVVMMVGGRGGASAVAGKGGEKGGPSLASYFVGQKVSPLDRYRRGFEALKGAPAAITGAWAGARANMIPADGKFANCSPETRLAVSVALDKMKAALEKMGKVADSQFGFTISGVNDKGQLIDQKGNPIKFQTKAGEAIVTIKVDSARVGVLNGSVAVGDKTFYIENAEIKAVSQAGSVLEGAAKDQAIKDLNFSDISRQIGDRVTLDTSMYSDAAKGGVVVSIKPFSETGTPEVMRTDGTKVDLTSEQGKAIMANVYEAHSAFNDYAAASREFRNGMEKAAAEIHLAENPDIGKSIADYRSAVSEGSGKLFSGESLEKVNGISFDHAAIEEGARKTAFAALSKEPEFELVIKKHDDALKTGMDPDLAHEKYIKPFEGEAAYRRAYNEGLAIGYGQYAGEDKTLRAELMDKAEGLHNVSTKARESLPENLRDPVSRIPVNHPEIEGLTKSNIGEALSYNARNYTVTHDNPNNLPASVIFAGTVADKFTVSGDLTKLKNIPDPNEMIIRMGDFRTVAGTDPGKGAQGFYSMATSNLSQAATMAREGKVRKTTKKEE